MKHILFICTGNTCRSPFASRYLQGLIEKNGLGAKYSAESAGTYAANGAPASHSMLAAAQEYDVDLSKHRARLLSPREIERAEIILCMEAAHKSAVADMADARKVFTLNEYIGGSGDIPDPFGGDIAAYRRSALDMAEACDRLMEKLLCDKPGADTIALGNDHAGVEFKKMIIQHLNDQNIASVDFGCADEASVDYADYAEEVCKSVLDGQAAAGILICGTGIGMSIAANKIPGIRASLCGDVFSAKMTRMHNDSNILCLGARVIGSGPALEIVDAWLAGEFIGGNHARRLEKVKKLERHEG